MLIIYESYYICRYSYLSAMQETVNALNRVNMLRFEYVSIEYVSIDLVSISYSTVQQSTYISICICAWYEFVNTVNMLNMNTIKYLQLFAPFCLAQSCEAFNVFTRARKMCE